MIMMTPERQLVNPFFTGGVADQRVVPDRHDGLRRAPPEHARQQHAVLARDGVPRDDPRPQPGRLHAAALRAATAPSLGGGSPFYGEGWPLYWEITMYDKGFHDTPEKRIGALFWRMHRCARIIFSLKFHMGEWSPQECVDFLVDRVGFERDNAIGEVRRSFQGGYGPLYQAGLPAGRPPAPRRCAGSWWTRPDGTEGVPRRDPAPGQPCRSRCSAWRSEARS